MNARPVFAAAVLLFALFVAVVPNAAALSETQTFRVPSPRCNYWPGLTQLSDGSFVYWEMTTDTTADPTADIWFVRTEPNDLTTEDFRVDRGDASILNSGASDQCSSSVIATATEIHEIGGDPAHLLYPTTSGYQESTDGGITWVSQSFGSALGSDCGATVSLARADVDSWGFVFGKSVSGACRPHVRATQDGGATWTAGLLQVDTSQIPSSPVGARIWSISTTAYVVFVAGQCQLYYFDVGAGTVTVRGTNPSNQAKVNGQTNPSCTGGGGDAANKIVRTANGNFWIHQPGDGLTGGTFDSYLWQSTNDGVSWTFTRLTTDSFAAPFATYLYTDGVNLIPVILGGATLDFGAFLPNGDFTGYQSTAITDGDRNIAGIPISRDSIVLAGTAGDRTEAIGNAYIGTISGIGAANPDITDIPVADLTQADMDSTGAIIAARTAFGDTIETFNTAGEALATLAGTNCDNDPEVRGGIDVLYRENSQGNNYFVAFGQCDVDEDVDTLSVRDEFLADPAFPQECTGDTCPDDSVQDLGSNFDVPADARGLGTLKAFPYTYERLVTAGTDAGPACWTFSTESGEIGTVCVVHNNNGDDAGDRVLIDVFPPNPVRAFCSWYDSVADTDYVAGVADSGNSPLLAARIQADLVDQNVLLGTEGIVLTSDLLWSNIGTFKGAQGIDCSRSQMAIAVDGDLFMVNAVDGSTIWGPVPQIDTTTSAANIVTMSDDTQFMAWLDGSTVEYGYASNGTQIGTVPVPSGIFRGLELNDKGGILAIYTSETIRVADISPLTCQANCTSVGDGFNQTTSTSSTSSDPNAPQGLAGLNREASLWASIVTIAFFGLMALFIARRRTGDGQP